MGRKRKVSEKFSYLPITLFTLYEYLCFNDEVLLMLFINA